MVRRTGGRWWPLVSRLLVVVWALLFAAVLSDRPPQGGRAEDGRQLYMANCAGCHGEAGNRIPVAPLDQRDYLAALGDSYLMRAVRDGRRTMPAFGQERGGPLTTEQIELIVSHLRPGQEPAGEAIAAGSRLYQRECVSCHGPAGDRLPVAPLNSPAFLAQRSDAALAQAISEGKGRMLAFGKEKGGSLAPGEIPLLVRFLRANAEGVAPVATTAPITATALPNGRDLYLDNCVACHGLDGAKLAGVDIGSGEYLNSRGESSLKRIVMTGQRTMPAFASSLSEEQVKAIFAYLRTLSPATEVAIGESAEEAAPRQPGLPPNVPHSLEGRVDRCLVCHSPTGIRAFPQDHTGRTNDMCLMCHQKGPAAAGLPPAPSIPRVPHDLAGRERCLTCHGPQGLRPVPTDHAGRTEQLCLLCHRPREAGEAGPVPRIPHKLEGREGQCLGCHTTGFFKPVPVDHAGRTEAQCPSCHKAGATDRTKPVPGIQHDVKGADDCLKCHGGGR